MAQAPGDASAEALSPEAAGEYLGTLFDDHARRVVGLCRALLRDPIEAEDAAQQTFLSAYRSLLNGHSPREPRVWLSAIARNECLARLRARAAEQPMASVEDEPAGDDVIQIASRHEEIEALRGALSELSVPQREAIVLREFYGLSYEEVGEASGLTTPAVKSALFRARKALKRRLRAPRELLGVAALPVALRDSLAQLVPGFASGEVGAGSAAKALSIPLAAKLAGATTTVAVVGVLGGAVAQKHELRLPAQVATPAAAATLPTGEPRTSHPQTPTAPAASEKDAAKPSAPKATTKRTKARREHAEEREEHREAEWSAEGEGEGERVETRHKRSGERESEGRRERDERSDGD
jgi:RNA polymerase sigma-70 factor, ECF subfamily